MSAGRLVRALAAALTLAALPEPARAGSPAFEPVVGLRAGWATSLGDAAANVSMSETVRSQIPVQLDLLLGRGPLAAGLYASYGAGTAGGCDPGALCTASSYRVGGEVTWTFSGLRAQIEPWVGAGLGYEWAMRESERVGTEVERYRGMEILSLQGGADFQVHRRLALGMFVLVSLGRYSRYSLETPVESSTREIANEAVHAWLEVGFRGRFHPWGRP